MPAPPGLSSRRRGILARRIRLLVAATITYNVAEAAIALTEGARVSSSALSGFGLDSVIEVSSAAAVAWQFAARDPETREKAALRFIAFSFFALAAYITVDAVLSLLGVGEARPTPIGIALAAASLVIMPVLSLSQRRAGRELGSQSAVADSQADVVVHVPVGHPAGRSVAQQPARLVVGGSRRGLGDRCHRSTRRRQRLAWRPMLLEKGTPMTITALVLFAVFGALGFGWRSWEQRRRTGSTGYRGISGRLGSAEWFAGVGFVAALVAAVAAPILQLLGVVSPLDFLAAPWIQVGGIVLAVIGIAATVYAQVDMGDSWRIGVDPGETTTLVRNGVFGLVRNPIFTAMLTFGFGIALVTPNVVAIVGFILLAISIQLQVRVVEEPYLLSVHGDVYRDYLANVGRFVPGVGFGK